MQRRRYTFVRRNTDPTGLSVIYGLPQDELDAALLHRWQALNARLRAWEAAYHRPPGAVRLLAASKGAPVGSVAALARAGQQVFGESYLAEARSKLDALATTLEWHYIGRLQARQCAEIARRFAWVHAVDRLRVAQRLAQGRAGAPPLNVCIEVNVGAEASKAGVAPEAALALAQGLAALPELRLRGLMCVPPRVSGLTAQRRPLRVLAELQHELQRRGFELDTLSMGMSDDLEAAVAEGATLVRVGTALFGPRAAKSVRGMPGR